VPQLGAVIAQLAGGLLPLAGILFDVLGDIGREITLVVTAAAPAIVAFEQIYTSVYSALKPVLELVIQLVAGALAESMKFLSEMVLQITPYLLAFAKALEQMFTWLANTVKELLGLAGASLPEFIKANPGASTGAAVATGTNIGSVESVIQAAMKRAFKGTSPEVAAAIKTADIMGGLDAKAKAILDQLMKLPEELWALLPGPIQAFLSGAGAAITDIDNWMKALAAKFVGNPATLKGGPFTDADDAKFRLTKFVNNTHPELSPDDRRAERDRLFEDWKRTGKLPPTAGTVGYSS
jgi:hypothetical protein